MNLNKVDYFINWGLIWRVAIISTGAIMLLYAPLKLNTKDLALFYAIYASYAAISIFDFGLTNQIFVSGYHKTTDLENKRIQSQIFVRFFLIALTYSGYGWVILYEVPEKNLAVNIAAITLSSVIQYAALLKFAYIEGCIDNKYSYLLRTIGEVSGSIVLMIALYHESTYSSIYALVIARALPVLIATASNSKNQDRANQTIQCENNFSIKIGLVMALGYMTSTGLINIIHWLYDEGISSAYSQLYLLQSTLFSLCMSIFLYYQKSIKDKFIDEFDANDIICFKKESVKKIQIAYILLSLGALIATELTKLAGYSFIKFNTIDFLLLFLANILLINNHVSTIIFRVKGVELTFWISILGGGVVLFLALLCGYWGEMRLFLISGAITSFVFNFWATNRIFEKSA